MKYDLYAVNVSALSGEETINRLLPYTDGDRASKIGELRNPMDKARSLGAGLLLSFAMKKKGVCITDGSSTISYGANGKPHIIGAPYYNLSHSGNYAVCAVCSDQIGIDIQARDRVMGDAMLRRCFSYEERSEDIIKIWSAKESFLKALGTGITVNMKRAEIIKMDPKRSIIIYDGINTGYICYMYDLEDEGYALTVCSRNIGTEEKIPELNIMTPQQLI